MSKLTQLKGEVVTLRNKIESSRGCLQDVLDLNRKRKLVDKMQKFFIKTAMWLIVSAVILTGGCTASVGGGASVSAFYPKKWESPESREQHTQPTIGMARNNLPMIGETND